MEWGKIKKIEKRVRIICGNAVKAGVVNCALPQGMMGRELPPMEDYFDVQLG